MFGVVEIKHETSNARWIRGVIVHSFAFNKKLALVQPFSLFVSLCYVPADSGERTACNRAKALFPVLTTENELAPNWAQTP